MIDKEWFDVMISLEEVDPEGPLPLIAFFLEHHHCGDLHVTVLKLLLPSHDVSQRVLVVNGPHLGPRLRVVVNGQQSVQVGHHQVAVDDLEESQDVLGLVLSGAYLQEGPDREVAEVYLQHC